LKKFVSGVIFGIILATTASVYADEGLQKIEAYLRPTLPITLNGQAVKLEGTPIMYDGSTYLKLRDVAGLTGLQVNWSDATQTVELGTVKGEVKSVATTSATPSTFDGIKAITVDSKQYYNVKSFIDKYYDSKNYKHRQPTIFKWNGQIKTVTVNMIIGPSVDLSANSTDQIQIFNGETYINTDYYPDIKNGSVQTMEWYNDQIKSASEDEKEKLQAEYEKFYPQQ
jgi:hypothetical protein